MKRGQPTHDQFRTDFLYEMFFPVLILGTMFLIGWGCWAYLDFHWVISLCVGLVGGFGLGIFGFLVALCELEKIEDQNGFGLE